MSNEIDKQGLASRTNGQDYQGSKALRKEVPSWLRETLVSPLSKGGGLKTPALRSTACFDRDDWDDEYRLHAGSSMIVVVRRTIKVRTHFTRSGLKGVCAVSWVEEEQQWCNTCDRCLLSSRFKHLMLALNSNLIFNYP